jgi:hypothetical protein
MGFIWLRMGKSGELSWTHQQTFEFHKIWGISWLAEQLLASQDGLFSMKLVSESVSQSVGQCSILWGGKGD